MVHREIDCRGAAYLCFLLTLSVMTADAAMAAPVGDVQACCTGGVCTEADPASCAGTSFLGATCDGPTACCDSGTCTDGTNPCPCLMAGGTPTLAECSDNLRPCCMPGASGATCQALDPVCCTAQGGLPLFGTNVDAASCDDVTCCLKPASGKQSSCETTDPCSCVVDRGGFTSLGTCDVKGESACCGQHPLSPSPADLPMFPGTLQELCMSAAGTPIDQHDPNLVPPTNPACTAPDDPPGCETVPRDNNAYVARLNKFLRDRGYATLGWHKDAFPRQTGPYLTPPPDGVTYSTHHIVRIYYSPEVFEFLCRGSDDPKHCSVSGNMCGSDADCPEGEGCVIGRKGECSNAPLTNCTQNSDCGGASDFCDFGLAPGSMIVKEMWKSSSFNVDDSGDMWIDETCYDDAPIAWAVMTRGSDGSHDDWFWTLFGNWFDYGAPPMLGRSAVTAADFFDDPTHGLLLDHDKTRYPTGQQSRIYTCSGTGEGCNNPNDDCPGPDCWWTERREGSVVDPRFGFNSPQDCLACHSSTPSAATFSDLDNILGGANVERYEYCASSPGPNNACPDVCAAPGGHNPEDLTVEKHTYTNPTVDPDPAFVTLFPQFGATGVPFEDVLNSRFVGESYDHIITTSGGPSLDAANAEMFITSDQCLGCHDATGLVSGQLSNMIRCGTCTTDNDCRPGCGEMAVCNASGVCVNNDGCNRPVNFSPYAEWRVSPMGMAGRDPIFLALVQTETNLSPPLGPCIETYCQHCHSAMAQRQKAIDDPQEAQCAEMLDPKYGPPSFHALFTRDDLNAWPGDPGASPEAAKYGGLGRDGVSCTVCHHMSGDGLSPQVEDTLMTANFNVDADEVDRINGPYATDVVTAPMQTALGLTPGFAPQIKQAGLCGTCHVLRVPVLKDLVSLANPTIPLACINDPDVVGNGPDAIEACTGQSQGSICTVVTIPPPNSGICEPYFTFEQTTYLEFLNSSFYLDDTTCQDCHMRSTREDGHPLRFQIANIQEQGDGQTGWPHNDNTTIGALPTRGGLRCSTTGASCTSDSDCPGGQCEEYGRHLLYGLNIFLNEMAQEFPVLMGLRQIDAMNSSVEPALLTARESVLDQANHLTVTLEIETVNLQDNMLTVDLKVTNLTGHKFPSGVGFRRAFIELLVCENDSCTCESGAIWGSGCTNSLGVIVDGTGPSPGLLPILASEFSCPTNPPRLPDATCPGPLNIGCPAIHGPEDQCYQPHYDMIQSEDEVQIYQELVADCDRRFTSSVTHLCDDVKDNRLLPDGWSPTGPFAGSTKPGPVADVDGDFVPGADKVTYNIQLTDQQVQQLGSVQATLYFQAIPPSYLNDRFKDAFQGAMKSDDIERLYYMTSKLNVAEAKDDSGNNFIKDWKLELVQTVQPVAAGVAKDESKCQQKMGFELGKFAFKKANEMAKCLKDLSNGKVTSCDPATGIDNGKHAQKIADAESNARAKINGKCADPIAKGKDSCPECYGGTAAGCRAETDTQIDDASSAVDLFFPLLACAAETAAQEKCQQELYKKGGKFAFKNANCLKKCRADEFSGKATGSCDADNLTDAKASACRAKEEAKLIAAYDKKCAGDAAPSCIAAAFPSGQSVVDAILLATNPFDPEIYCEGSLF